MTHEEVKEIAEIIKKEVDKENPTFQWIEGVATAKFLIAYRLAQYLASKEKWFNHGEFMKSCGIYYEGD